MLFVAPAITRRGFHLDADMIADSVIVGAPAAMTVMRTPLRGKVYA